MAKKKTERMYPQISKLAGNYMEEMKYQDLSKIAQKYIDKAFDDIRSNEFRDYHCHIFGIGTGNSGNFMHPKLDSWLFPVKFFKSKLYFNAAGIKNIKKADQEYIARFYNLTRQIPGKFSILAWDKFYNENGTVSKSKTLAYVPNDLVYNLAKEFPDQFLPCVSIHPYRKDALKELEKWAELGIRQLKWAPNSMGIDASNKKCEAFYKKMTDYNMVLLTHTGKEEALPLMGYQHLGNPLLFRRPLDMGVKIIMAHCASLGRNEDFESKGNKRVKNFKLFLRLIEEEQYEHNLFGDISGITQFNRSGEPLRTLLQARHLHHRLVNGSDYPMPAINSVIWTKSLQSEGFISRKDRKVINEIYKYNPLLFDFILKRIIKHPKTGDQFKRAVFRRLDVLEPSYSYSTKD